jgi:hypothetical protein
MRARETVLQITNERISVIAKQHGANALFAGGNKDVTQ